MEQEQRPQMDVPQQPHVGDVVIFTDSRGVDYNALVTAVFGEVSVYESEHYPTGKLLSVPCINAVWLSSDPRCQDPYGRQIERHHTSIVHRSSPGHAGGIYWRWPGEEKLPIQAPTER